MKESELRDITEIVDNIFDDENKYYLLNLLKANYNHKRLIVILSNAFDYMLDHGEEAHNIADYVGVSEEFVKAIIECEDNPDKIFKFLTEGKGEQDGYATDS